MVNDSSKYTGVVAFKSPFAVLFSVVFLDNLGFAIVMLSNGLKLNEVTVGTLELNISYPKPEFIKKYNF